jgi:hypothetical protein
MVRWHCDKFGAKLVCFKEKKKNTLRLLKRAILARFSPSCKHGLMGCLHYGTKLAGFVKAKFFFCSPKPIILK